MARSSILVVLAIVLAVVLLPRVFGGELLVVQSSSMGRAYPVGSLVVARSVPAPEVAVGDVVLIEVEGRHPVLHRVHSIEAGWVITKGDANLTPDPEPYPLPAEVPVAAYCAPYLGYLVGLATTRVGWLLLIALPATLLAALTLIDIWSGDAPAAVRRPPRIRRRLSWLSLGMALAMSVGVVAALAVFADTGAAPANALSTATKFGRVATGTYTGNGVDNRAITGIGFAPEAVIVKGAGPSLAILRTSTMTGDASKRFDASAIATNQIESLAADGFTIGTDGTVNTSGAVYAWVAFDAFPARLAVGTYTGSGVARSITGLDFSPEYVVVAGAGTTTLAQRSSTMTAAFAFANTAMAATAISSLDADGFSVDASIATNANLTVYHYLAWNANPGTMATGLLIGNGLDNWSITGVGFSPQYVVVKRAATGSACEEGVQRPAALAGDDTAYFAATANTFNAIQALQADGFQVGTDCRVNTLLSIYNWVAFRDS